MIKRALLFFLLVVPGTVGAFAFGLHALKDRTLLHEAEARFLALGTDADIRRLFVAYAAENARRINVFALVVWSLLSAILAGVGLHGLCTMPRMNSGSSGVGSRE